MKYILGPWRIDCTDRSAVCGGRQVRLSPRALRLLHAFADAGGQTLSRQHLLDSIWPNVFVGDESLTQVVSELRRAFRDRDIIATVPRAGYRLKTTILRDVETGATTPSRHHASVDAYARGIEAQECCLRAEEGWERQFVALAAEAVAAAPTSADARALHATALCKRHLIWSDGHDLIPDAHREARIALGHDPNNPWATMVLGAIAALGMDRTESMKLIGRALTLAPNDPALHLDAAFLALCAGNLRNASALSIRAARLDPNDYCAEFLLSRVVSQTDPCLARRTAEAALRKVRVALDHDPCSMRARYSLGPLLAQLGDFHSARAALEGVSHHDTSLEYSRAVGFAMLGDVTSAIERLSFLAERGWRHHTILETDPGLELAREDPRFGAFRNELLIA